MNEGIQKDYKIREYFEKIIAQPKKKGRAPRECTLTINWKYKLININKLGSCVSKKNRLPEYSLIRAIEHIAVIDNNKIHYYLIIVEKSAPLFVVVDTNKRNNVMFFTDDISALFSSYKYLNIVCCGLMFLLLITTNSVPDYESLKKEQEKLKLSSSDHTPHHTNRHKAIDLIEKINSSMKMIESTDIIKKPLIL